MAGIIIITSDLKERSVFLPGSEVQTRGNKTDSIHLQSQWLKTRYLVFFRHGFLKDSNRSILIWRAENRVY